jgi:acetyl esterase
MSLLALPDPDRQPAQSWLQKLLGDRALGGPPITSVDMIPERRRAITLESLNGNLPPLASLDERVPIWSRGDRELTAEVYVPPGTGPFPVVLYMHGGAWCVWGPRDVRRIATRIAAAGHVVVNLDYGLAPEHPFPAAVEDVVYAARWLTRNGAELGGDGGPLILGGDSAGANLSAAAIAFLAGHEAAIDEGDLAGTDVDVAAALLLCGAFDFRSRLRRRDTSPGTTEVMLNLAYLGTRFLTKHLDPLVSPIYAPNLERFPPTYLNCGSEDAVLPDTLDMVGRLGEAGVDVTASVVEGVDHEFLLLDPALPHVEREWQRMLRWLADRAETRARGSIV